MPTQKAEAAVCSFSVRKSHDLSRLVHSSTRTRTTAAHAGRRRRHVERQTRRKAQVRVPRTRDSRVVAFPVVGSFAAASRPPRDPSLTSPSRPRRSLFRAKAPPQAPLEPVNVNYRAQVRANADTRLLDVHPGIPPSSHKRYRRDAHFKNRLPSDAPRVFLPPPPSNPRPRQAAPPAPAHRGAATPKAHREVVVEDGFKYKRRKSGTPGARAGPSSHRVSGGAIVLKSEKSETRDVSQRLSSSLPPDYPGLSVHERVPEDLPEEERMQMLIEEICELSARRSASGSSRTSGRATAPPRRRRRARVQRVPAQSRGARRARRRAV